MLSYAYISDDPSTAAIPARLPNGGLDTGAQASGPWGNVSVVPEPVALSKNLLSAKPPPNAEKQPVTFMRPGNNPVDYPYHQQYKPGESTMMCLK